MQENYGLTLSLGSIHAGFLWAHEQIDREAHWAFVVSHFLGVLCIDEVHDSGRTILFATDPLDYLTVLFKLVEKNDQDHMDAFLQSLKERGLKALKKVRKDAFEKMIVFLGWENVDRTNNHVERNNRVFRMLQKTRY